MKFYAVSVWLIATLLIGQLCISSIYLLPYFDNIVETLGSWGSLYVGISILMWSTSHHADRPKGGLYIGSIVTSIMITAATPMLLQALGYWIDVSLFRGESSMAVLFTTAIMVIVLSTTLLLSVIAFVASRYSSPKNQP